METCFVCGTTGKNLSGGMCLADFSAYERWYRENPYAALTEWPRLRLTR